jgi:ATP-dependent exoDNAse (exonuclease V) beta subunit
LLSTGSRQTAWSATALSAAVAEALSKSDGPRQLPRPLPAPREVDPESQRRIGRAVHDALAKVRLPRSGVLSEEDRRIADSSARAQHLSDTHAALVVALVSRAVAAPTVRALAARRHWKELALAAPLPGGDGSAHASVLEGFADLVGESDEGLVVVDFKTAASRSASAQYLSQVAAYAYALREATGRSVAKVSVLYLNVDGAEEDSLAGEALEDAIAAVLEAGRAG